jgi:hypothetical protein
MSRENCLRNCPFLKPFCNENITPDDLMPEIYNSGDDLYDDKTWELQSPSGSHTDGLARTKAQVFAFREGIDVCPEPKAKKIWKVSVSRRRCQNPGLNQQ